MQILLFVLSMIMVIGIMTYTRIETYLQFSVVRHQLESYMTKDERQYYSFQAINLYDKVNIPKPEKKDKTTQEDKEKKDKDDKPKKEPRSASSKLPIFPLLQKETREGEHEKYLQIRTILKKLIDSLYKDTRFYKRLIEQRPDFVDEIIDAVPDAVDKLPSKAKIKKATDLANLDLQDSVLNEAFYKILKGTKNPDSAKNAMEKISGSRDPTDDSESISEDGYLSLTDFIDVKDKSQLRVYLASKKLLDAMTSDPALAQEIVDMRTSLYRDLDSGKIEEAKASEEFKNAFLSRLSPYASELLLNFDVSKTDPRKYN